MSGQPARDRRACRTAALVAALVSFLPLARHLGSGPVGAAGGGMAYVAALGHAASALAVAGVLARRSATDAA